MLYRFLLLVVSFTFTSGSLALAGEKIFILAGQSNMHGKGKVADLSEEQRVIPKNVTIFLNNKEWDIAQSDKFGPEVSLAQSLSKKYPDDTLYFVKMGVGGTSLYFDWAQERTQEKCDEANKHRTEKGQKPLSKFKPGDSKSHYHGLIYRFENCKTAHPDATVEGIFWMQGEQDCRIEKGANNYAELLKELAECLRRDLSAPEAPFVYGLINCEKTYYPLVATVKEQQRKAVEIIPNSRLVDTEDLEMQDGAHFSTASYLKIGERFADAYSSLKDK